MISKGRCTPDLCAYCNRQATAEGHDACLGTIPGPVMNACCGHGDISKAYIQFNHNNYKNDPNAKRITGSEVFKYLNKEIIDDTQR